MNIIIIVRIPPSGATFWAMKKLIMDELDPLRNTAPPAELATLPCNTHF
jgi:hypothetical protein